MHSTANPLTFVPSVAVILVVIRNVTTNDIVNRFAKKINVIWNAVGANVGRNVTKVLVNVICNVTVENSVIRFARKMNVIWNATDRIARRYVKKVNAVCNVTVNNVVSRFATKVTAR